MNAYSITRVWAASLSACIALFTGLVILRTVRTNYKGFCARLGPSGKSRTLQELLESTKKNRGSYAFFGDN